MDGGVSGEDAQVNSGGESGGREYAKGIPYLYRRREKQLQESKTMLHTTRFDNTKHTHAYSEN
jgi:hypothetical protein